MRCATWRTRRFSSLRGCAFQRSVGGGRGRVRLQQAEGMGVSSGGEDGSRRGGRQTNNKVPPCGTPSSAAREGLQQRPRQALCRGW